MYVQRSTLFCANIVKKDPGKARQNSLATAGTNFTKPGAHNKVHLCTMVQISGKRFIESPAIPY